MAKQELYELAQDKRGAAWDALLYIPTVVALVLISIKLWYSGSYQTYSYIVLFAATFIFFIGFNRILGGRLMMMPKSPRQLEVVKKTVAVTLKSGERVELVKDLRYFSDYAGKSFALTGMDLSGSKRQFVFHRAQFAQEGDFKDLRSTLSVYK